MPRKKEPNQARNLQRLMEEEAQKPAHIVLLDYGRKAGIQNAAGKIIAIWRVYKPEDN